MRQIDMYICHPFRGKCKQYNHPESECNHAKPHRAINEMKMGYCYEERDCICGGICRKIKVAKSTSHNKRKPTLKQLAVR